MKTITKVKNILKEVLPERVVNIIKKINRISGRLDVLERNQRNLINSKLKDRPKNKKTSLRNKEFKIYSQNGEDGILLHIFSKIGVKNKNFVEIGIGDGKECNTTNLSMNHGWAGLLMDGDKKGIAKAKKYYKKTNGRVKVIQCFITKENVNEIIKSNGVSGKVDLLSIDIDGNDYWIWKEIKAVDPNVVVEYNGSFGRDRSISVCYDPGFERIAKHKSGFYHGASLKAFTKLGKKKGYSLVGGDATGCNAFFVKKGLVKNLDVFKAEEAYYPHKLRTKERSTDNQFKKIKDMKFERI